MVEHANFSNMEATPYTARQPENIFYAFMNTTEENSAIFFNLIKIVEERPTTNKRKCKRLHIA